MIDSITFLYAEKIISITFEDGEVKRYDQSMKANYLKDFPDRGDDIVAIGW